jgi:medium-chain acyl-[acyl-carrier-protein] hydrolase
MAKANIGNHWIDGSQANAAAPARLFCFPHVGGGRLVFRSWSAALPEIEVCPVLLPGRDSRLMERPFDRLGGLVQSLASALPFDKPFALFGHSMGALVGFELVRELRRRGQKLPAHLFVASRAAPQVRELRRPHRHLLPEDAFIRELRLLNGTAEEVLGDPSLIQFLLPVLRADFAVVETYAYSPEEPLACPITAFGGESDDEVSRDQLLAWNMETRGTFVLRMFPGGHFFLHEFRLQLLQTIGAEIRAVISQLRSLTGH